MDVRCLRNSVLAVLGVLAFAPAAFSQVFCTTSVTGSLPSGTTGQAYSATLTATTTFDDDVSGTYTTTWSASGLPAGLSLSPASTSTTIVRQTSISVNTTISGTPTAGGTFPVNVTAAVSGPGSCQGHASFSVNIVNAPAITTTSPLPNAEVGVPYATAFTAINGGGTFSWSSSAPPAGLTLSSSGVLSGTPTSAGTFTISVTAAVPNGQPPVQVSGTFSLMVASALAITTPSPLPSGIVGTAYSQPIIVTGGFPQPQGTGYSFALSGPPAPGLTFNAGIISGTPTMVGTFQFTLTATDTQNFSVSKQFQLTIAPATALLQVSPAALAFAGFVGGGAAPAQTLSIVATGAAAVNFSISVDNGSAGTAAPSWITVTPTSGTAPGGVTVIANAGSMAAGVYPATIHISVPQNTSQSTINVPVTFTVTAGNPTLAVWPESLNLGTRVQTPSTQNPIVVVSNLSLIHI